jgi:hypothetical protein
LRRGVGRAEKHFDLLTNGRAIFEDAVGDIAGPVQGILFDLRQYLGQPAPAPGIHSPAIGSNTGLELMVRANLTDGQM